MVGKAAVIDPVTPRFRKYETVVSSNKGSKRKFTSGDVERVR